MSVSGGVMANAALDAALDELGMLSTITTSRQGYLKERLSRLATLDILEDHDVGSRNTDGEMRTRASSMSTGPVRRRNFGKYGHRVYRPYGFIMPKLGRSRSRTRSENESDLLEPNDGPRCSSNQHSYLDPVPCIALPIDSMLSSNLFKSRSMESIDARTSDESVCATEKESVSDKIASLNEVDSVSSGLHRLNVSE